MGKNIETERDPFAIPLSDPCLRGFSTSQTDPQNMDEAGFVAYGDPLRGNISANSVGEMVESFTLFDATRAKSFTLKMGVGWAY